jgi:hypothetical protein
MTEGIPADEGNELVAASLAGMTTAACVGVGNADNGGGPQEEADEYDQLLASLGRSEEQDQRIAIHELGHYLTNSLLGKSSISAVSITPGEGYEGVCWGQQHSEAFVSPRSRDAASIRELLHPVMPNAGEDRGATADVFQSVLDACTELMAGTVAEKLLLEGEPSSGSDDFRQATELATLICKSPQAVMAFIGFWERQAFDLLSSRVTLIMGLQIVLRIRRTMTGEELNRAIATMLASEASAIERCRRADWRARELAANSFQIDCGHVNGASLPRSAPDRVW